MKLNPQIQVGMEYAGLVVPLKTEKTWGYELTYANDSKYCMKMLYFKGGAEDQVGPANSTSMHFHIEKHETLLVMKGVLTLWWIENKEVKSLILKAGDAWRIPPGHPHKLISQHGELILLEASTADYAHDSIRIM